MELGDRTFVVDKEAYGELIKELSQILGKPYMQTFKCFQKFEPHEIESMLSDSQKWAQNGFKSRSMAIWTYRKINRDNT